MWSTLSTSTSTDQFECAKIMSLFCTWISNRKKRIENVWESFSRKSFHVPVQHSDAAIQRRNEKYYKVKRHLYEFHELWLWHGHQNHGNLRKRNEHKKKCMSSHEAKNRKHCSKACWCGILSSHSFDAICFILPALFFQLVLFLPFRGAFVLTENIFS